MVTFALPGDYDAAPTPTGTPKSRPPLPFAKRTYVATPYATKRFGTPQSSARKAFTTRDEVPSSSLNHSTMASSRNIFRASTANGSPSVTPFSPNLPQNTMKKVFAPGVTPEPNRVYRETTAKATPRGVASASEKELFGMRIASPPPELTGEVLANKVPKEWNSNGSIYADQFLSHLCPPDFDDEQRRQFFCILDLRRLKYAANEIFAKKSWKLNIINFAKEFEKSRSIILLRYGLYEFQNVKPSKEVLKRWRREHGLPDPVEDEADEVDPTPTKPAASKKRKADENLTKITTEGSFASFSAKRRVTVRDESDEPTAATPAPLANKRKAPTGEESPSKLQKAAPSSAKSLFEKIANKPSLPSFAPSTTPAKSPLKITEGVSAAAAKPSLFSTTPAKPAFSGSVLNAAQPSPAAVGTPNSNIFSYLSDGSSAKNSGVDADGESETESEQDDSQEAEQSVDQGAEQSGNTSGAGETDSQSSLFNAKPAATGFGTGVSSVSGTRESTPSRSLFDRVSKDKDGQPLRAEVSPAEVSTPVPAEKFSEKATEKPAEKPAAPLDQTWNPSKTPLKFAPAPSASTNSLFGLGGSSSSALFTPKASGQSNLFGPAKSLNKEPPKSVEKHKGGDESDKENDSRPSKKPAVEDRPALQPSVSSSLFMNKQVPAETPKSEAPKAATSLFGSVAKPDASITSNLFGSVPKAAAAPAMPSSTLFGAKPAEPAEKEEKKTAQFELPKSNSLFGAASAVGTPSNLFAPKPTTNGAQGSSGNNLFGNASSTASTSLFGSSFGVPAPAKTQSAPAAASQPAAAPLFNFGASTTKPTLTSQAAATSLFGAPQSPPASTENEVMGSPMKQDVVSPVKKPSFGGIAGDAPKASPLFSFGSTSTTTAPSLFGSSLPPATSVGGTSNIFGGSSSSTAPAPAPTPALAPPSSSGFNFNFGGSSASSGGSSFNNPFASGTSGNSNGAPTPAPGSTAGSLFSFGASSAPSGPSGPSGGSGGMFQFGGPSSVPAASSSAPIFGGAPSSTSGPTSAAAPPSSNMFAFGGNQPPSGFGASLQPPAGGSSTTGTNSPFNLGEGSSLATTPAGGTPEPFTQGAQGVAGNTSKAVGVADNNDEDGEKHEQISLTGGVDEDEEMLHEVRAKVLKFVGGESGAKSKSPWMTQGVGPLRLLKSKETGSVRLLLRAEPRGNVVLNKLVLPGLSYKADEKYVKLTASNDAGDGLETWMLQVKTKEMAKELAEALETNKQFNKKT